MPGASAHEQMALDYLAAELQQEAPQAIRLVAGFDERPLQGEGPVTIFAFTASLGGGSPEVYYVIAGQTAPNYYPQWGLTPDQIYSVHLGTRFMLVVEVRKLELCELPATLEEDVRAELAGVVPGEPMSDFRPVAAFAAEGQKHAVCRMRIADEEVYVMAADLPLGLYREIHLPPHVVYRWHLGNIIRMERDEPQDG